MRMSEKNKKLLVQAASVLLVGSSAAMVLDESRKILYAALIVLSVLMTSMAVLAKGEEGSCHPEKRKIILLYRIMIAFVVLFFVLGIIAWCTETFMEALPIFFSVLPSILIVIALRLSLDKNND